MDLLDGDLVEVEVLPATAEVLTIASTLTARSNYLHSKT
jgi:hypothetical protein